MHTQHKEGAEVTLIVHPEVRLGTAPYPDPKTLLDACVQVLHSTRIADMSLGTTGCMCLQCPRLTQETTLSTSYLATVYLLEFLPSLLRLKVD